jgi:hypothetical protein
MERPGEDLLVVTQLDDPAKIHHRDVIADVAQHREFVANGQALKFEFVLNPILQVDFLSPYRDTER